MHVYVCMCIMRLAAGNFFQQRERERERERERDLDFSARSCSEFILFTVAIISKQYIHRLHT